MIGKDVKEHTNNHKKLIIVIPIFLLLIIISFIIYLRFSNFVEIAFTQIIGTELDHFADNLLIPEDIEFNYPKLGELIGKLQIDEEIKNEIDFELYTGTQLGIYWYKAWINNLDSGFIY
jgi:hypothetical protein